MSYYKRVVYVDCYENGVKISNAGFVKLLKIRKKGDGSQNTCMQIYILNLPWKGYLSGQVVFRKADYEAVMGMIEICDGKGFIQVKNVEEVIGKCKDWEWGSLEIQLAAGRVLWCGMGEKEIGESSRAVSDKEERELQKEDMPVDCEAAETEVMNMPADCEAAETEAMNMSADCETEEPEVVNVPADCETEEPEVVNVPADCEMVKEQKECRYIGCGGVENKKKNPERRMKRDKWEELWEILPHIKPFGDDREYLKLQLQDLLVLPKKYYRLTENSFLLHGYYNYEHLIMTKVCWRGSEKYLIGVPGNYYERETQVAVWFGFESFEPKAEPASDGDYGYYMISVEI